MLPADKKLLKAVTLELRHLLEGRYDGDGNWKPGDLEQRLAAIGVRREKASLPVDELPHLADEDRRARQAIDAYLKLREDAGLARGQAVAEFVRETAFTWANRLLALRAMEARELIDAVILQQDAYGGRSLEHHRLAQRHPELCTGDDDGLFAVLDNVFHEQAARLPMLFDPHSPSIALRPSAAAIKDCFGLLSLNPDVLRRYRIAGVTAPANPQSPAPNPANPFTAPDALGWAYQYWNTEEKDRVFERVRTVKGAKIAGADIIPATQLYTEDYMVKFLVQNSLGATWLGMHPDSRLAEKWEYYVKDADRAPVAAKALSEVTFLDPACGSGHFLLEAFDLFYDMYVEEGVRDWGLGVREQEGAPIPQPPTPNSQSPTPNSQSPIPNSQSPAAICDAILTKNLFGIDIDARAVQIAEVVLWMKAAEKASDYAGVPTNLVAATASHLKGAAWEEFLSGFEQEPSVARVLKKFAETMEHIDEIGSLARPDEDLREIIRQEHALWERQVRERREANYLFGEMKDEALSGQLPFHEISDDDFGERLFYRAKAGLDAFTEHARAAGDFEDQLLGSEARAGFRLLDLLSRRYDVVAANPPYLGSKHFTDSLKAYVSAYFHAGRRDLFGCFILRSQALAIAGGRVGIVAQESWMFLKSFADLRCAKDQDGEHRLGLLCASRIELIARLGAGSFSEITGEVVKTSLVLFSNAAPVAAHAMTVVALPPRSDAQRKAEQLRRTDLRRRLPQTTFVQAGTGSSISYWVPNEIWQIIGRTPALSSMAVARKGMTTMDNERFVRWSWEAPPTVRWVRFTKSLPFCRWQAPDTHRVDWALDGARPKAFISEGYGGGHWSRAIANVDLYFREGCWCSIVSGGSPSFRNLKDAVFETKCIAVIPETPCDSDRIMAYLNTSLVVYLLRALSPGLETLPGAVERLPIPPRLSSLYAPTREASDDGAHSYTAASFGPAVDCSETGTLQDVHLRRARAAAMTTILEMWNNREAHAQFGISEAVEREVFDATGNHTSSLRPIGGLDAIPDGYLLPADVREWFLAQDREAFSDDAVARLLDRMRRLYEAGPSAGDEVLDDASDARNEQDEELELDKGVVVPPDTFLEDLSRKAQIHPLSTYWLLHRGVQYEGWRCMSEELRLRAERLSVRILRLLGHRWPKQIEAGEAVPEWADPDGIIPLTPLAEEETLVARVEKRLAAEEIDARDFEQVMGKPLGAWLASEFFKHHTKQFKKRPIAWQLQSGKYTARRAPAFACLVYYHKLNADTLPKLRSQYVGPLRQRLETELRGIQSIAVAARSDRQEKRRVELEDALAELAAFDAKLEQVARAGFATPGLAELLAGERLDGWCSLDGRRPGPASADDFLAQESAYAPDINDGVRVNIAPLQKAGLLAADVLARKDLEKAIADRSVWRADERRWVREGKLPRPGWWEGV